MNYLKVVLVALVLCGLFSGCESSKKKKTTNNGGDCDIEDLSDESGDEDSNSSSNGSSTPSTPPTPPPVVEEEGLKLIVSNGSAHTVPTSLGNIGSGGSAEQEYTQSSEQITFVYDTLGGYSITRRLNRNQSYYILINDSPTVPGTVEVSISSF